jgi:flagellin
MVINTNTTAMINADNLQNSQTSLARSLSRLSSGSRIVKPSDDAGGLAAADRMSATLKQLDAVKTNVSDAISYTQTQDGYLKGVGNALARMSELATLAQDVTKTSDDLNAYASEFTQLQDSISKAFDKTFNGVSLFSASPTDPNVNVTVDADGTQFQLVNIDPTDTKLTPAIDKTATVITDLASAHAAVTTINTAISAISQDRATVGGSQARLLWTADQLTVAKENLTAAHSTIMDVDIAEESTNMAKQNVLVQSGTAMLAQANQMPQSVLKLLQ